MRFKNIVNFVADVWLYKIPFAAFFVALIYLGSYILFTDKSEESLINLYSIYISTVALSGALAAILFSYIIPGHILALKK